MKLASTFNVCRPRGREFQFQLRSTLVRPFYLAQAVLRSREVLERGFDRAAVLSFQTRKLGQSILNLFESGRRELKPVREIAQRECEVLQQRAPAFEAGGVFAEARVILSKLLDAAQCLAQS